MVARLCRVTTEAMGCLLAAHCMNCLPKSFLIQGHDEGLTVAGASGVGSETLTRTRLWINGDPLEHERVHLTYLVVVIALFPSRDRRH